MVLLYHRDGDLTGEGAHLRCHGMRQNAVREDKLIQHPKSKSQKSEAKRQIKTPKGTDKKRINNRQTKTDPNMCQNPDKQNAALQTLHLA